MVEELVNEYRPHVLTISDHLAQTLDSEHQDPGRRVRGVTQDMEKTSDGFDADQDKSAGYRSGILVTKLFDFPKNGVMGQSDRED